MGQAVSSFAEGLGDDGIPLRTHRKMVTATSPRSALRMSTEKQNQGTGSKLLQEASEKLETQPQKAFKLKYFRDKLKLNNAADTTDQYPN